MIERIFYNYYLNRRGQGIVFILIGYYFRKEKERAIIYAVLIFIYVYMKILYKLKTIKATKEKERLRWKGRA